MTFFILEHLKKNSLLLGDIMHVYMVRQKSTGLYAGRHDCVKKFSDTAQLYFALTTAKSRLTRLLQNKDRIFDKDHPKGYDVYKYNAKDFEIIEMKLCQNMDFRNE